MTVAPTGVDVTSILWVLFCVKVAQFGESRTLVSVRRRKKRFAPVILIVGLPYISVFLE
jgi:hypothetical protein